MYIAQQHCPNFRVLSDFRKDNVEFFRACFKQTVQLAIVLKLPSRGHVSLDCSKFKASSSKHKAMSYQRLKEKEAVLTQEIDELIRIATQCDQEEDRIYQDRTEYQLPADLKFKEARLAQIKEAKKALEDREQALNPGQVIDGKKHISFADKGARIMGKKGGAFDYAYNAQISVDEDNQIIVGQHVSQRANDELEVEHALSDLEENTDQLPDKMSLDNGYMSGDNLAALAEAEVDAYIATDWGEKSGLLRLDESGRELVKADFNRVKTSKRDCVYQGEASICNQCRYQSLCCQSSKGKARTINTDNKEAIRQRMNVKMELTASKEVFQQRKVIVEPVFGQIKMVVSGVSVFAARSKLTANFHWRVLFTTSKKSLRRSLQDKLVWDLGIRPWWQPKGFEEGHKKTI
jgi:transposase